MLTPRDITSSIGRGGQGLRPGRRGLREKAAAGGGGELGQGGLDSRQRINLVQVLLPRIR